MSAHLMVDAKTFEKLFPFSFIVNQAGHILAAGPSFKKLNTGFNRRHLITDLYNFSKPYHQDKIEDILKYQQGDMLILESRRGKHQLMGQVISTHKKNRYVFIVNLFVNDVNQLNFLNLTFNDFAVQDQIFDFLMLLQTHQKAIREADVINKKLAEAHQVALKASILKSQFLANMSHELRTPMNGVLGMASVLAETELSSEQKDYVDSILESGENMLSLINDILDLSKIEAGYIQFQRVPVDLRSLLDEVATTVRVPMLKKNIEFIRHVDSSVTNDLLGDPDRIRQVIINLVGNSVKFTDQGYVKIEVKENAVDEKHCQVEVLVEDTGIGMSEQTMNVIFNPFVQGDGSTTKKFGGTGLGLSICKKLVNAMHGDISVESREGYGSKFKFYLTLERNL